MNTFHTPLNRRKLLKSGALLPFAAALPNLLCLTFVAAAATALLAACGGGSDGGLASAPPSAGNSSNVVATLSSRASRSTASRQTIQSAMDADASTSTALVLVSATTAASSTTGQGLTIQLPAGASVESVKAILNGRDVTANFRSAPCAASGCLQGSVSASDGMRSGKNVLYATAVGTNGAIVSGRLRFAGLGAAGGSIGPHATVLSVSSKIAVQSLPTSNTFMPPAVGFKTLAAGGPNGKAPWLQVGQTVISSQCGGTEPYIVAVLDRQTLEPKPVGGDEPGCFVSGAEMATYLATLGSNDLVIVGTRWGYNADGALNTSSIGGSNRAQGANPLDPTNQLVPKGYMAIGVGGAPQGQAYENFYAPASWQFDAFANGSLLEDPNGNYNFVPANSGPLEYAVAPNDPTYQNTSTVRVSTIDPLSLVKSAKVYSPPVPSDGGGGFWVLQFHRSNMQEVSGCGSGTALSPLRPTDLAYPSCGKFYETGSASRATAASETQRLMNDLQAVPFQTLVAMTTLGRPFSASGALDVATNLLSVNATAAVRDLGAPTGVLQYLFTSGSAFTLLSSRDTAIAAPPWNPNSGISVTRARPDFLHTLNGDAVLSTTVFGSTANGGQSNQGQTGFVRGVLLPDNFGLYEPSISTQSTAAGQGMNLGLHELSAMPATDWPELTTLLPGASSIAGERAAYAYLSFSTLLGYYLPGLHGAYLDDIHYYFTGGLNTQINLSKYDPQAMAWPGDAQNDPFPWQDPVSGQIVTFTVGDYYAVRQSLHDEIGALGNVLTFMSTGSASVKDLVVGGQNSAALALISAGANVAAGALNPPTNTPASVNLSDMSNFFGGIVSIATSIATGGAIDDGELEDAVSLWGGITSGSLWSLGSLGFKNPGDSPSTIPSASKTVLLTLGSLANSQLQNQMSTNFDASLDIMLSDYNKLVAANNKILDSGPDGWYSARSNGRAVTVTLMGYASERSFYMSLMSSIYSIDYWQVLDQTGFIPDVGGQFGGQTSLKCAAFYPYAAMPTNSVFGYPHAGDALSRWDVFVIGGAITGKGSSKYTETLPGSELGTTLFDPAGSINIPMLAFFSENGPLPLRQGDVANDFTGFGTNICSPSEFGATPISGSTGSTSITLDAPSAAAVGGQVTLRARISVDGGATVGSTVLFTDGNVILGTSTVDSTGTAVLITTLAMGPHQLDADLIQNGQLRSSSAAPVTTTIYPGPAGFSLGASAEEVIVGAGSPSSAIDVQIDPNNGFAGVVKFSCTGLPEGFSCQFAPNTLSIDGAAQKTQLTIVPDQQVSASSSEPGSLPPVTGMVLLPLAASRRRAVKKDGRRRAWLGASAFPVLVVALLLSGCGGGNGAPVVQESKTVLVTASDGKTTHTIPVTVTVKR